MRHPCRTADQDNAADIVYFQFGVAQCLFHLLHGFADKMMRHLFEGFGGQFQIDFFARRQQGIDCDTCPDGEAFLGFPRLGHQQACIFC